MTTITSTSNGTSDIYSGTGGPATSVYGEVGSLGGLTPGASAPPTSGGAAGNAAADAATAAASGAIGTDAQAIIQQVLDDYGLGSLTTWAWGQITDGATASQVTINMAQTPQFQQRFPGIAIRQQKGLPAISPADYINYEDSLAQLTSQYGIPQGIWDTPQAIGTMIGNDVSINEAQARIQNGFSVVATAPPQVRASFASMFGAAGDGALAAYVMDEKNSVPVLEQQVTAAQLQGTAALSSVDINNNLAMQLAQQGTTVSQVQNAAGGVAQQQSIYDQQAGQASAPTEAQGVEAALGTDATASAEVAQAQSAAAAAFKGGGGASADQYGAEGVGSSRPL